MRRWYLAGLALLAVTAAACGGEETTGPGGLRTGTYMATTFVVQPAGQASINVLGEGGSLSITIKADGTTTGALIVPASVTGGAAVNESMAGTITVTQLTVSFDQAADTFVRDLSWSRQGEVISVTNQPLAGNTYTIALVRQ